MSTPFERWLKTLTGKVTQDYKVSPIYQCDNPLYFEFTLGTLTINTGQDWRERVMPTGREAVRWLEDEGIEYELVPRSEYSIPMIRLNERDAIEFKMRWL